MISSQAGSVIFARQARPSPVIYLKPAISIHTYSIYCVTRCDWQLDNKRFIIIIIIISDYYGGTVGSVVRLV